MANMLVANQILMAFQHSMIIGFPGRNINLNGQMARLNLNGMAKRMLLVAACG
jgi:hypothetical protein